MIRTIIHPLHPRKMAVLSTGVVLCRNMKILFVHPPVYDFACHDFWLKPYGLLKLAGLFHREGADVHMFDFLDRFAADVDRSFQKSDLFGKGRFPRTFIEKPEAFRHVPRRFKRYGRSLEAFQAYLSKIMPVDAVFLTCSMTYWYPGILELIPYLDGATVYLGGSYATFFPEHASSLGLHVVTNDRLASFLSQFGLSEDGLYQAIPHWKSYSILPHIVTRISWGCPCGCSYCGIKKLHPQYTVREEEEVLEEIVKSLRPETEHVVFYDDALLQQHEMLFDLCSKIRQLKKVHFHTPNGLSINLLTVDVSERLRKNGFGQIYLGYETSDDRTQELIGGKTSTKNFKLAVAALRESSFALENIHAYILMGHELIPPSSVERSIYTVLQEGITPFLADYSPIPGTQDGDRVLGTGGFDPLITNKTSWTYRWASPSIVQSLKDLAHSMPRS